MKRRFWAGALRVFILFEEDKYLSTLFFCVPHGSLSAEYLRFIKNESEPVFVPLILKGLILEMKRECWFPHPDLHQQRQPVLVLGVLVVELASLVFSHPPPTSASGSRLVREALTDGAADDLHNRV
jgi:hypothetical protein